MKLDSNDFELFDVPMQFAQDAVLLAQRWKALQAAAHPDRFAAQGAAAQRVAMQWSVRINQAYQRLKDPLQRAAYLCELHGVRTDAESNTAMPADFLQQQMLWREALDEANEASAVQAIESQVQAAQREVERVLQTRIDAQRDWTAAAAQVRAWMFVRRFAKDVDRKLGVLQD